MLPRASVRSLPTDDDKKSSLTSLNSHESIWMYVCVCVCVLCQASRKTLDDKLALIYDVHNDARRRFRDLLCAQQAYKEKHDASLSIETIGRHGTKNQGRTSMDPREGRI